MSQAYEPRKIPVVSRLGEATRLLQAACGLKYQSALGLGCAARLRASEATHLTSTGIDGQWVAIRVDGQVDGRLMAWGYSRDQGKGVYPASRSYDRR